jgi:hypothetical protein
VGGIYAIMHRSFMIIIIPHLILNKATRDDATIVVLVWFIFLLHVGPTSINFFLLIRPACVRLCKCQASHFSVTEVILSHHLAFVPLCICSFPFVERGKFSIIGFHCFLDCRVICDVLRVGVVYYIIYSP